jgi:hypothetical protein
VEYRLGFGSHQIDYEIVCTLKEIEKIVLVKKLGVSVAAVTMSLAGLLRQVPENERDEGLLSTIEQLKVWVLVNDDILGKPTGDNASG